MKLVPGNKYRVKVVDLVPVGAVVKMEDNTTELVHISNIADCYVRNVGEYVTIGQEYEATCQVGRNRPAELSFVPLCLKNKKESFVSLKEDDVIKKPSKLDTMIQMANSVLDEKRKSRSKREKKRG